MTDLLAGTATATDCIAIRTSASVCKVQTQSGAALVEPVLTNSETRKKAALGELHSFRHQDKLHIGRDGSSKQLRNGNATIILDTMTAGPFTKLNCKSHKIIKWICDNLYRTSWILQRQEDLQIHMASSNVRRPSWLPFLHRTMQKNVQANRASEVCRSM